MKYTLGKHSFTSKEAIKTFARNLIKEFRGQSISPEHKEFDFFSELISMHPNRIDKIGSGISRLCFRPTLIHGDRNTNMIIERTDGSEMIISFSKCLYAPTVFFQQTAAMRTAVYSHTLEYRVVNTNDTCSTCESREQLEVDHVYPFSRIRDDFLKVNSIPLPTETVLNEFDMPVFTEAGKLFCDAWIEYHNSRATYQILCKTCNGQKSNKYQKEQVAPPPPQSRKLVAGQCYFQFGT